ncbi:Protein of unknown function (DUF581 [Striga hermonthica]|uniref:FLZ-type domain-containing protein n=1 Tax=Striga hermonthica TaxID=68872 RepID=A0A9N7ND65_STRHE|nr:Protein of unknown function (DUF581 [Striga hermonthica]
MADQQNSLPSPNKNPPSSPISSFLNSPRFFNGFLSKNQFFSDTETNNNNNNNNALIMSPTSTLDTTKNNLSFVNPFGHDKILSQIQIPIPAAKQDTTNNKATGLALIDSIIHEKNENGDEFYGGGGSRILSKPVSRAALYGSKNQLKVQIPHINPTSSSLEPSPQSPAEFGIKTKNSKISSPFLESNPVNKDFTRQLSLKEMELSEDYTCVIYHGPNPKTTHIFDDCVVDDSCLGDHSEDSSDQCKAKMDHSEDSSPDFLSFCHTCKDILEQGKDIYIYRGEKAFCSHECRCEEMFSDGMKYQDLDER